MRWEQDWKMETWWGGSTRAVKKAPCPSRVTALVAFCTGATAGGSIWDAMMVQECSLAAGYMLVVRCRCYWEVVWISASCCAVEEVACLHLSVLPGGKALPLVLCWLELEKGLGQAGSFISCPGWCSEGKADTEKLEAEKRSPYGCSSPVYILVMFHPLSWLLGRCRWKSFAVPPLVSWYCWVSVPAHLCRV